MFFSQNIVIFWTIWSKVLLLYMLLCHGRHINCIWSITEGVYYYDHPPPFLAAGEHTQARLNPQLNPGLNVRPSIGFKTNVSCQWREMNIQICFALHAYIASVTYLYPLMSVCRAVGRLGGRSVCRNFLLGREVTVPCSYRSHYSLLSPSWSYASYFLFTFYPNCFVVLLLWKLLL